MNMLSGAYPLLLFCGILFTAYGRSVNNDPCPENDLSEQCLCSRTVDVAIVGAGPSGSYSAYRLRNDNLTVEVFEYFNRVGGRLYTAVLPDAPDVPFELGGMIFSPYMHERVVKVVDELGIPTKDPPAGIGSSDKARGFWGGQHIRPEEAPQLYDLNENEKIGNLMTYLFEKLTGQALANMTMESLTKVKLLDGRYLYSVPLDEALDLVASKGAKTLVHNMSTLGSLAGPDTSLLVWEYALESLKIVDVSSNIYKTPVEGMNAIPRGLMDAFLRSSPRHQLTLNRRLLSISPRSNGNYYKLVFKHTETTPMGTTELDSTEVICAKKVILAINKFALSQVQWDPIRAPKVQEAINAVRNIPALKVFLSFPVDWWMRYSNYPGYSMLTDLPFNYFAEWGNSSTTGHYVVMASYSDEDKALFLHKINTLGEVIKGSTPGSNQVTNQLSDRLLSDLSEAFGIDRKLIPEPVSGISQFWNSYPFGGGWTIWKAGYFYDYVISIVQRPSPTDDVFYVSADHSKGQYPGWTEGALEAVDRVFENYFL